MRGNNGGWMWIVVPILIGIFMVVYYRPIRIVKAPPRPEPASVDSAEIRQQIAEIKDCFNTAVHDTTTVNPRIGSATWFREIERDMETLAGFTYGRYQYEFMDNARSATGISPDLVSRGHTSLALRTGKRLVRFFDLPQAVKDSTAIWVPYPLEVVVGPVWTDSLVASFIWNVLDDAGLPHAAVGMTYQGLTRYWEE